MSIIKGEREEEEEEIISFLSCSPHRLTADHVKNDIPSKKNVEQRKTDRTSKHR